METLIRLGSFAGVFLLMSCWEILAPRRHRYFTRLLRWTGNLGLVALSTLLIRLLIPVLAVGLAMQLEQQGMGLLNILQLPYWLAFLIGLLLLDLAIYLQHVMFHAVPSLWRLHRVHHADLDFDLTTGLRFHPLEMLLSMLIKLGVVLMLGPPALAVLVFEVMLNATSMFNHANARIPLPIDRVLRWLVVTPDMHRVHHSIYPNETNSNFGFNLPWWDRLLGTYQDQPHDGHEGMTIGIEQFRTDEDLRLGRMLVQPWRGPASVYPINRRGQTSKEG